MYDNYCTTCGAFNSYKGNSDNGGCSECYDTEGIIWDDHPEWDKITGEQIDEMAEYYGEK